MVFSSPRPAYAPPTPCPVLTYAYDGTGKSTTAPTSPSAMSSTSALTLTRLDFLVRCVSVVSGLVPAARLLPPSPPDTDTPPPPPPPRSASGPTLGCLTSWTTSTSSSSSQSNGARTPCLSSFPLPKATFPHNPCLTFPHNPYLRGYLSPYPDLFHSWPFPTLNPDLFLNTCLNLDPCLSSNPCPDT
eukprot:735584-Rhodomonas_salina.2